MLRVAASALERWARQLLATAGLDRQDAAVVAGCLVEANLRGVDSHGVLRLPQYVDALRRGEVNPSPQIRVVHRRGATAIIDADGGYGYRPTFQAVSLAVELARQVGVGAVGVRNSHHFGMAASYTLRAAEAGVIGFVTTTATPSLGPPGSARPGVGNNPVSWAVPRRPPAPALVLDMALSEVALGKIRLAAEEGRPIPTGWAYDIQGRPTTDPREALRSQMLVPVGNHKGYGLAVIMDVLAGVLTGSPFGRNANSHGRRSGGVGHMVLAVDPGHFVPVEEFYEGVEQLVADIKSLPLAPGASTVYLPGEPEWETSRARRQEGIPLPQGLARHLRAVAEDVGVEVPSWLSAISPDVKE